MAGDWLMVDRPDIVGTWLRWLKCKRNNLSSSTIKFMYKKYHFETLDIYHLANDFVLEIYRLVKKFPKEELFGLAS